MRKNPGLETAALPAGRTASAQPRTRDLMDRGGGSPDGFMDRGGGGSGPDGFMVQWTASRK